MEVLDLENNKKNTRFHSVNVVNRHYLIWKIKGQMRLFTSIGYNNFLIKLYHFDL